MREIATADLVAEDFGWRVPVKSGPYSFTSPAGP